MRAIARLLVWIVLLTGTAVATADPLFDDTEWLRTMAFAAHQTNYSGVFVYQAGNRVELSRITHLTDEQGEHERLQGLEGQRREVVRHNDRVWLYLGDKQYKFDKRHSRRAFPALLPEQILTLKENYIVTQEEEDRVADYHVHTIRFQPRDGLRYARKMWAHSESGLLLKAVVLDEHDRVIEQYAFSQLQIGGNIDSKWLPANETDAEEIASRQNLSPLPRENIESVASGWQVDGVPSGFKKIIEMRRTLLHNKIKVVQIVYSDGLAALSVFIEPSETAHHARMGLTSRGAVHVYRRRLDENYVTVVGELPPRAVLKVAESVRYAGVPNE
ncbi:MAG: transcriptional regulator [Gallionellaceae bacterium CG_4_9_14_0_8_um_filter_60_335]|nr:MAG: transcriptional regulator [Gallionellaceae bacterium CG_4_9_14_0_8_um_filter_60_335]